MLRKTTKSVDTATDRIIKDLNWQIVDARNLIMSAVKNCIVRNEVINLYPESSDKDKAIEYAEAARLYLLHNIAQYDCLMEQYDKALLELDDRQTTLDWTNCHSNSHKVVEIAYENFYKKS